MRPRHGDTAQAGQCRLDTGGPQEMVHAVLREGIDEARDPRVDRLPVYTHQRAQVVPGARNDFFVAPVAGAGVVDAPE